MNLFIFILSDESLLYWRGHEETEAQAWESILKTGYRPIFIERVK